MGAAGVAGQAFRVRGTSSAFWIINDYQFVSDTTVHLSAKKCFSLILYCRFTILFYYFTEPIV
jgi:hypothetical protein